MFLVQFVNSVVWEDLCHYNRDVHGHEVDHKTETEFWTPPQKKNPEYSLTTDHDFSRKAGSIVSRNEIKKIPWKISQKIPEH